jgi:hypothetical protein
MMRESEEQLFEVSLSNYCNVYQALIESNPSLEKTQNGLRRILKAFKKLSWGMAR